MTRSGMMPKTALSDRCQAVIPTGIPRPARPGAVAPRIHARRRFVGLGFLLVSEALLVTGCQTPPSTDDRRKITELEQSIVERDKQIATQKSTIDALQQQLAIARSISEDDLKKIFYPETIEIEKISSGFDADGKSGDDGVTVYLKPLDRKGDVIKVAGDVNIQLFDLAAPTGENLLGEYKIPVDQLIDLWYGKLMSSHFMIKCPWLRGPPKNPEVTIRVTFVDYLTKRVITSQSIAKVKVAK